jgi:hypothetical protein
VECESEAFAAVRSTASGWHDAMSRPAAGETVQSETRDRKAGRGSGRVHVHAGDRPASPGFSIASASATTRDPQATPHMTTPISQFSIPNSQLRIEKAAGSSPAAFPIWSRVSRYFAAICSA